MKKIGLLWSAVSILLVLSLCCCQYAAAPPEEGGGDGSGQMVVVNDRARSQEEYGSEYPSIEEDPFASGAAVSQTPVVSIKERPDQEIRSVWISYLELDTLLKNRTGEQFRTSIAGVFDNVRDFGLNTVIVHVRPFGDAIYRSDYFPWSYLVTGTEGKDPGFDPLEIMITEARARGLRLEAWINPYRVRAHGNENALCDDNQAAKWLAAGEAHVIRYGNTVSYNPASTQARQLIVNGVREIVRNYDVDGIHIDDYFYPHSDEAFDSASYEAYRAGGGALELGDWRRANVEALIGQMYRAIKEEKADVLFGISPQSSISNNYNEQYLDVKKLAATPGYCDYLCPQIYFGFQNDIQPYAQTLRQWDEMIVADGVELYVGLAVYKAGKADSWAGSGSREWQDNTDLISRMVRDAREKNHYRGFVLYRYESVFQPESAVTAHIQQENENLKALL